MLNIGYGSAGADCVLLLWLLTVKEIKPDQKKYCKIREVWAVLFWKPITARRYPAEKADSRSFLNGSKKIKTRLKSLCYGYGKQL